MVDLVFRLLFLMQGSDRVGYKIDIYDVDFVVGSEWQCGKAGQENERLDHVELGGLGTAAIAQDDARPENGLRSVRKQDSRHVLAKFLGAGVGVVVGTIPFDRTILGDD